VKLWALDYHDDDAPSGSVRVFFSSKVTADQRAIELDADPPGGYFRSEPFQIDVPTTKSALLDWLNSNATAR
jgi:hypothetical protein